MQNFSLKTHIGADGVLHLDLPVAVKNTDLKVTVSYRLLAELPHKRPNKPLEYYAGSFSAQEADNMLADILESRIKQYESVSQ
jgi:hypothetical protein